jgi:hypothetical protein
MKKTGLVLLGLVLLLAAHSADAVPVASDCPMHQSEILHPQTNSSHNTKEVQDRKPCPEALHGCCQFFAVITTCCAVNLISKGSEIPAVSCNQPIISHIGDAPEKPPKNATVLS